MPFPISYMEAMNRYGSDKPDTRFGGEIMRLDYLLGQFAFNVFRSVLDSGGSVRALCVKGVADRLSRKEIDKLTDLAKTYKLGGLAFTRLTSEGESSSFEKFLTPEEVAAIRTRLGAQTGDVILIAAHTDDQVVSAALGAVRLELGRRFELYDPASFNLLWVTDFPLFEYDDEDGRYYAMHHPFTAPHVEDMALLSTDPGACRAQAYDMVINGVEVGGGSIRISDPTVQQQMFAALGLDEQAARARFGYFLDAFDYGVPPHGGLAYGLDRLVMLLLGRDNIRDVIAFPKVQNASELMTQAPSPVDAKDLEVLGITVTGPAQ